MTATSTQNIVLIKDGTQVTIALASTGEEENWTKGLTTITPPKTTTEQGIDEGKNDTIIVDILMKAEQRYTFDGYLVTGLGSGDTSSNA